MQKKRVFISSVQSEFAEERAMLYDYLRTDALLGQIFEPFIFEKIEAKSITAQKVYLEQVEHCDIYLGILGEKYGNEDENGVSPTENEYNLAAEQNKIRLIYLKKTEKRDEKETAFIKKIEQQVVRKTFTDSFDLKTEIYASLIRYLEEEEIIRIFPFDATINRKATLEDIDIERIKKFIRRAKAKRNFPFDESDYLDVLLHLNLMEDGRFTNAALLLFGKQPQKFVISSCVKCCQFYGNETVRPIPSLQIYEGDLFQLIDQAVSFVMSRIDAKVGGRYESAIAEITPELPLLAVTEAIVNAVCHRDYTSNGSVQIMLYKNRLEIWNPGQLPFGLTPEMLKGKHRSLPPNPLIARPLYLYGAIEQVGTGTEMLVNECLKQGLLPPDFSSDYDFSITFWRKESEEDNIQDEQLKSTDNKNDIKTDTQVNTQVEKLILCMTEKDYTLLEIKKDLQLKNRISFMRNYIQPALKLGLIEMTIPDKPNSRLQKYRLTQRGLELKSKLKF